MSTTPELSPSRGPVAWVISGPSQIFSSYTCRLAFCVSAGINACHPLVRACQVLVILSSN